VCLLLPFFLFSYSLSILLTFAFSSTCTGLKGLILSIFNFIIPSLFFVADKQEEIFRAAGRGRHWPKVGVLRLLQEVEHWPAAEKVSLFHLWRIVGR
jgi:hypothetical protein